MDGTTQATSCPSFRSLMCRGYGGQCNERIRGTKNAQGSLPVADGCSRSWGVLSLLCSLLSLTCRTDRYAAMLARGIIDIGSSPDFTLFGLSQFANHDSALT